MTAFYFTDALSVGSEFFDALAYKEYDKAQAMLKSNPLLATVSDPQYGSVLHRIVDNKVSKYRQKQIGLIHDILRFGAHVNPVDQHGNTPLHLASDLKIMKMLIKAGADPNARNNEGETPIFNLTSRWNIDAHIPEKVKLFKKAGAKLNVANAQGLTPLANAILHDGYLLSTALLENGASATKRDYIKLVLQAASQGHIQKPVKYVKLLQHYGGNPSEEIWKYLKSIKANIEPEIFQKLKNRVKSTN